MMWHLLTGMFAFLLLMIIFEYPAWTVFILGVLLYGLFICKKTLFIKKQPVTAITSLESAREKIQRLVREHHDFLKKSRKEGLIRNQQGEIDNSACKAHARILSMIFFFRKLMGTKRVPYKIMD